MPFGSGFTFCRAMPLQWRVVALSLGAWLGVSNLPAYSAATSGSRGLEAPALNASNSNRVGLQSQTS